MPLYLNGNKVLEGSYIVATDGTSLKPLADNTYNLGDATHGWKGIYVGQDALIEQYSVTSTYAPSAIAIRNSADDDDCRIQCAGIGTGRVYTFTDNAEVIVIQGNIQAAKATEYTSVVVGVLGRATLDSTSTGNFSRTTRAGGLSGGEFNVRIESGSAGTVSKGTCILFKGNGEIASDGAALTTWVGLWGDPPAGAGTKIQNVYMIYLDDVGSTGQTANYSIYSAGGASYHVGSWNNVGDMIIGGADGGVALIADGVIRGPANVNGVAGDPDDTAGADLYIKGAVGRGSGDVGQIIFQTAQVAAADTAHTLETILTLDEDLATFSKAVRIDSPVVSGLQLHNTTATLNKTSSAMLLLSNDVNSDTGVVSIYFANDNAAGTSRRIGFMGFAEEDGTGDGTFFVGVGVNETITERLSITSAGIATLTADLYVASGQAIYNNSLQVVGGRQVDARIDDTPNSGDVTTDGIIAALQACVQTHGLMTAA